MLFTLSGIVILVKDLRKNKHIRRKIALSLKNQRTRRGKCIIPVSKLIVVNDRESGEEFVGNFLSFGVGVFIQYALDVQPRNGNGIFNQFLKHGYGSEGTPLHTDGNLRKEAAFNLIVFGTARRIMTYVNLQSGFQRKIRQILLEHSSVVTVTAAAVSGKQKPFGLRIIKSAAQIPPSPNTFHRKLGGVRACGEIHKARLFPDVIKSVGRGANRCKIVVDNFQRFPDGAQKRTASLEIPDYFFFFSCQSRRQVPPLPQTLPFSG